ncbi:hypothetical protein [Streptomyces sp. NPDC005407]|uniref:hypothetical protein n=1 Tax=Streptomyces sp. NPDC005407 TaxID=3155340 RepID=UPI0033A278C9
MAEVDPTDHGEVHVLLDDGYEPWLLDWRGSCALRPLFALASRKASCPDPTCRILHNSAWGTGASQNALDAASRIDNPILLPVGSENGLWLDSQTPCHEVLANRQP